MLRRVVACAAASLQVLRRWLGAPNETSSSLAESRALGDGFDASWQRAFVCADSAFVDARIVLRGDVAPPALRAAASGGGKRLYTSFVDRMRGCSRLCAPLYKVRCVPRCCLAWPRRLHLRAFSSPHL